MRSFLSRATVLSICAGAAVVSSGCEGKKATEYVAGFSTQVTVPRDLKAIRLDLTVGGLSVLCQEYKVYDGKVQLPRSLGAFPNNQSALKANLPVTFTIVGLTEEHDPDSPESYDACRASRVGVGGARILRRSRQPYVPDEILFLPMPLKYSCYDKDCDDEEMTCKGGKCVPATIADPASSLPRFRPDLIDGSGGACFSVDTCMGASFPAIVVDPETCTYAVAGSPSAPPTLDPAVDPFRPPCADASTCASGACTEGRCEPLPPGVPWDGVNVAVVYDAGVSREILDKDPDEGFTIPDPAKPQQFRLAEGLCEMVKGRDAEGNPTGHRITAVRASGVCQAKSVYQPLCARDQLAAMGLDEQGVAPNPSASECRAVELRPPPSALMVVADNTERHRMFFNVEELKALELPLRDPALAEADLGLVFTNGDDTSATCAPERAPTIALGRSGAVRQQLIDSFVAYSADPSQLASGGVSFEGALESAYEALGAGPGYHRRAVVVLGNRGFDDKAVCGGDGPVARAGAALTGEPGVETYVVQLVKNDPDVALDDDVIDPEIYALAEAGIAASTPPYDPDARSDKRVAKEAFQRIIESLATCVYDVDDAKAPASGDVLSFTNPLDGAKTTIPSNPACDAEEKAGEGWGFAPGAPGGSRRVVLCADSCAAYRQVVRASSDFALLYQQPAYAVPMFAHKGDCGAE